MDDSNRSFNPKVPGSRPGRPTSKTPVQRPKGDWPHLHHRLDATECCCSVVSGFSREDRSSQREVGMRGHMRQRGDAWELRAYVGKDPVT